MNMEQELTYEKAFERLSEIVEKMSTATVPLDELIKLYEEGMELSRYCEKLLNGYEARLQAYSRQAVLNEIGSADAGKE